MSAENYYKGRGEHSINQLEKMVEQLLYKKNENKQSIIKTLEWHSDDINYWRINKDDAKQLNEDWHDLMDKYNISDSALIVVRVIGSEKVNTLTLKRGKENMFTILYVADQLERKEDALSNKEIDQEEKQQDDFLDNLLNN